MIKLYEVMNSVYLVLNKGKIGTCICANKTIFTVNDKVIYILTEALNYKKSLLSLKICLSNYDVFFKTSDELIELNKSGVLKIVDKIPDTDKDKDKDKDKV